MIAMFRDRLSVSRWLQALAFILPMIVLAVTVQELVRTRRGSIQATETQMARLDMVFAEQTGRAMETLDQILRSTADAVEVLQDNGVQSLARLDDVMRRRSDGIRQIAGIAVAAPDGRVLISTFPNMSDGFRHQVETMIATTADGPETMRIGKPFRDGQGPWMALMTRRITDAGGVLRGYAVGFINLKYFEDFYEAVQLSENGAIVLHLRDGTVLARYPHTDSVIGTSFADLPPFKDVLSKAQAGTLEMASPIDGVRRVLAIRALKAFPLAVNISVGEVEVLRAWAGQAVIIGIVSLVASLLIGGLLLLLAGRAREREALVQALARAKDAALEAGQRLAEQMAERERAEEALRKAQRIEAVGQLTGGVAHDFNNLLTVVLSNIEMLLKTGSWPGETQQMLLNAREAAERGAVMTGQLLAFSRQQPLQPAPVDTRALVEGMGGLLRSALGGGVVLKMALNARNAAMADANQVELVILNLALNARDAMPGGGTLTIETWDAQRGAPESPEQPLAGDYVVIAVRDTGTGMTAEVSRRAFDPFFTTKGPGAGSGLGLSQVYGLAQQSGGQAEIDSAPGEGTTVRVWLPSAGAAEPQAVRPKRPEPQPQSRTATILVVDDDPAVRDATVRLLRGYGYTVLEDAAAGSALERLDQGAAIQMVLSDIVMPGMSGLDLARAARRLRPGLPFVFISGYADPGDVAAELGALRLVRKPFRAAELISQIEAALADARGADAPVTASV
jgi:signal transduction histidine kinase/ActR/RegA family two-component response regulator